MPLKNLTVENLRLIIGQQISLSYLVPVSLDILQIAPLAQGDMYPDDLLINAGTTGRKGISRKRLKSTFTSTAAEYPTFSSYSPVLLQALHTASLAIAAPSQTYILLL